MAHDNADSCCQMSETIICRCEEVTENQILDAITDGATTVTGVKIRTRAGMGLCQGRTCRRLVSRLLGRTQPLSDIVPSTFRAPVRTAKIREYIEGDE